MKAEDIIEEARERIASAIEAESELREDMLDDYRFEGSEQWPEALRKMREGDPSGPRPCLTVNLTRKHKNALLNEIRRSRPSIRVLPVDDKADPETAEVLNGLLRHIQSVSDADIAYDTAAEHQITGGVGYFRLLTAVMDEDRNEQELRIDPIINPFSVYMDPNASHPAGKDAEWAFITEEMPRKRFERDYPDAEPVDFDVESDAFWCPSKDVVTVVEYFCVKQESQRRLKVDDDEYSEDEYWDKYKGSDERPKPVARTDTKRRVMWYKMTGSEILDERELPCSYIPVIRVAGEERRFDNRRDFRGIVRDLKDPGRMYNYWTSVNTEFLALSPKAPYIGPAEAFEGHEDDWRDANTANKPYLVYNQMGADGEKLDRPQRAQPPSINTAILESMARAQEDMRQVSGQSQAGFGEQGNEKSGIAINARRQEQDNNTYHFVDNLARSIKHAGRIMIEMIPRIYDTRRVVRILGEDETPDFATIDPMMRQSMVEQPDALGKIQRIYNPGIGRFDVRVVVGPTYATKAEEAADRLSQIISAAPDLMAIAGDILFKNMDIPGSDELSERMKTMLPPQIQELEAAKKDGQQQGMQQAEMVRQQMMAQIAPMVEELKAALDMAAQENEQLQAAAQQMKQQLDDKAQEFAIKEAELQVKREEANLKHQAEMADAEAEVAVAMIQARTQEPAPQPAPQPSPQDDSGLGAMIQQLAQQIQAVQSVAQEAAQAAESVNQDAKAQISQLAERVASGEAHRQRMAELAEALLSGRMTDEQAAATLGRLN